MPLTTFFTGLSEKKNLIIWACLIITVNWVANFYSFTHLGLYIDDHFRIPGAMEVAEGPFYDQLRLIFDADITLRPLHVILIHSLSIIGYKIAGLPGIYLIGYLITTTNAVLCYILLRRISKHLLIAVTGALFFCLYPISTTKIWITSFLGIQPALTILVVALIFYVSGRHIISHILMIVSLFCYETIYPVFLAAPLLKLTWDRTFALKFSKHVLISSAIFTSFFIFKTYFGDPRLEQFDVFSALSMSLNNMIAGPVLNLKKSLTIPLRTFSNLSSHWIFLQLISFSFFFLVFFLLYRTYSINQSTENSVSLGNHTENYQLLDECKHLTTILVAGICMLILGYPMTFYGGIHHISGHASRIHSAATMGATLLVTSAIGYMFYLFVRLKKPYIAVILIATFFSSLMVYNVNVQDEYRKSWELQRKFFRQILMLCPDINEGTLILIQSSGIPKYSAIGSITWSVNRILEKLYQFPSTWSYIPRLYLINTKAGNELPVNDIINAQSAGDLARFKVIKDLDQSDFNRPVELNNMILLNWNQETLERQEQICVADNKCYPLKKKTTATLPTFNKGILYQHLIQNH